MANIIQTSQTTINKICKKAGISYLALFGSQSRGEATSNSDVDLLVDFKKSPSLIGFIKTKHQFEKAFHRQVDLVTKTGLSKYIKPYIQADLQKIYG